MSYNFTLKLRNFLTQIKKKKELNSHYKLLKSKHQQSENLIIFFIPHYNNEISGGILSIFSLAKESRRFKEIHNSEVVLATFPEKISPLYIKDFLNDEPVYNFIAIQKYFKNIKNIIIHVPEYLVPNFWYIFSPEQQNYLRQAEFFQINIMNQNMNLMPRPELVSILKPYCNLLTITTSHLSYSKKEFQQLFKVPYSRLGTYTDVKLYDKTDYDQKNNVVMLSIDYHPSKPDIIKRIRNLLPNFSIIMPSNIPYEEYKKLMRDAKFMITFGEGMDSYFTESVLSGSVAFAIYEEKNQIFFTELQRNFPTVYKGSDEALKKIASDIKRINDDKELYKKTNDILFDGFEEIGLSHDLYLQRIKRFYEKDYDFK